ERSHRLTQRGPPDCEGFGQVPFRRQPAARNKDAPRNELFEPCDQFIGYRDTIDPGTNIERQRHTFPFSTSQYCQRRPAFITPGLTSCQLDRYAMEKWTY